MNNNSSTMLFMTLLARGLAWVAVIFIGWHIILSSQVNYQEEKNLQLNLLIDEKEEDIEGYEKRHEYLANFGRRLNFIVNLMQKNQQAAQLLSELHQSVPATIQLTQLLRRGNTMTVNGYTESDDELLHWMNHLATSSILTQPVITAADNKNAIHYFQMQIGIK